MHAPVDEHESSQIIFTPCGLVRDMHTNRAPPDCRCGGILFVTVLCALHLPQHQVRLICDIQSESAGRVKMSVLRMVSVSGASRCVPTFATHCRISSRPPADRGGLTSRHAHRLCRRAPPRPQALRVPTQIVEYKFIFLHLTDCLLRLWNTNTFFLHVTVFAESHLLSPPTPSAVFSQFTAAALNGERGRGRGEGRG